jgi:UPF0716 protein FxsA
MRLILLTAFIAVPIIEIAVFIEVGGWIGLWPTLGLVILTAVVGSLELRSQGIATLNKLRSELDRGVMPAQTLFDGVCLLFAGALLLTPGFVTDVLGLALFVPAFRKFLRVTLGQRIVRDAEMHVHTTRHPGPGGGRQRDDGVIDADYVDVTEEDPTRKDGEIPGGKKPDGSDKKDGKPN